jgi:glutamyl-tRNA synthetase
LKAIVSEFLASYDEHNSKDEWFSKIKIIARNHGYAENTKSFKQDPSLYKGNVADIAKILRVLLTGKAQTPDLYMVMLVMGKERIARRLALVA